MSARRKPPTWLRVVAGIMWRLAILVVVALAVMAKHMYQTVEVLSGRP